MICSKCGDDKPEGEFQFRNQAKGTRRSHCKTCMSGYNTGYYAGSTTRQTKVKTRKRADRLRNQQYVQSYLLTHGCVDCPESDPTCLDFDHVRGKKFREICLLVRSGYGIQAIKREITKCEVRCANCHRKITAKRRLVGTIRIELTSPVFQAGAKTTSATSPLIEL